MRLALVQQPAAALDPGENLARGERACVEARQAGADLVVFPELWQTAYPVGPAGRASWAALSITIDDPWVRRFQEIAADHSLAMVITFLRRRGDGVANSAAVLDSGGEVTLVYDKVHTCDFSWERDLVPGDEFRTAFVRTRAGEVRLGVMTCFDREFPESARALALGGAELIVCPNACLICDDRLGQLRARAFENMAAVAMANYPLPAMNGRSCAFDGVAVENGRPRDHCLVVAGPRARLVLADLDLLALRRYRADGIWEPRRRRPIAYRSLTATPDHTPDRERQGA